MQSVILLAAGFILLIKGADWFVDSSSLIAEQFRIPAHIIGMTIIAFGTSAPELSVSLTAAFKGSNEIAIGNVIGSCLINLLLVGGVIATIKPFQINKSILSKNYPYSIVAALSLLFLSYDTFLSDESSMILSHGDGLVLLIFFGIFLYFTVSETRQNRQLTMPNVDVQAASKKPKKFYLKHTGLILVGLLGVILGGQLIVNASITIARLLHISEAFIGLTVIAIGTSLPEGVTSVIAARKGQADIALGNIIGSNIYNIFLVLGLSSAIHPIQTDINAVYDMVVLIVSSLLFYIPMFSRKKVGRLTGSLMIGTYILYVIYISLRG